MILFLNVSVTNIAFAGRTQLCQISILLGINVFYICFLQKRRTAKLEKKKRLVSGNNMMGFFVVTKIISYCNIMFT